MVKKACNELQLAEVKLFASKKGITLSVEDLVQKYTIMRKH